MSDWKPTCSIEQLKKRAYLLTKIRSFFYENGVMEVETPLLGNAIGTDPGLDFFSTRYHSEGKERNLFLQTSPEFAMKRLLAAGSGSIFQICKAFRNGEAGKYHNPEFSILEWYRTGFTIHELMDEVFQLLRLIVGSDFTINESEIISYQEAFICHAEIDPIESEVPDFIEYAENRALQDGIRMCGHDKTVWLDYLFSHLVQPNLGRDSICFVYHFPSCQSSLARVCPENPKLAERFEVFINGIELANGFHELADASEQSRRFEKECKQRKLNGQPEPMIDSRLLSALQAGFPDCSGVALGIDRLLMLVSEQIDIGQVISFSIDAA